MITPYMYSGDIDWNAMNALCSKSWEADFRDKSEVLSMTEIVCCRKVVELCQSTLIAGYYYHHLHRPKRQSKSTSCKRFV